MAEANPGLTEPSVVAHRACWIEEAHVTELTELLREGPDGDQLAGWPRRCGSSPAASARTPAPGCPCSSTRTATGTSWRGQAAYIDTGHRVYARVEDSIRTGKATGIGRFPSHDYKLNQRRRSRRRRCPGSGPSW